MYVGQILPYRTLEFNCIQQEGKHSSNKLIVFFPSLVSILVVVCFGSFDGFSGFVLIDNVFLPYLGLNLRTCLVIFDT